MERNDVERNDVERNDVERNDVDWIRDLLAVMFVLGLLVALVGLSRSRTGAARVKTRLPFQLKSFQFKPGTKTGRSLILLDRLALTPANSLHLVRADSRTFLLAVHSAGVVLLSELISAGNAEGESK